MNGSPSSRPSVKLLSALTLMTIAHLSAQPAFELAGHSVAMNSAASFTIRIGEADVPISIFHGAKRGPVFTLTAGIHGDEYPSILALQRLRKEIHASQLSGTLILVHLANVPGFLGRRIAVNPIDEKNLNRIFPGKPDGTLTEQLADFLTKEVINKSDYLIDMHSGSAHEELWPHVYSPAVGPPDLDARTLAFAKATGMRHIVIFSGRSQDPAHSVSYPNTATVQGKPALTIEIGDRGRSDEASVLAYLVAMKNAMRHLRMIDGSEIPNYGFTTYRKLVEVDAPNTGLFFPQTHVGKLVNKGALLAEIIDYFGDKIGEIRSPTRGVIFMLNDSPAITKGETPVTIGEVL